MGAWRSIGSVVAIAHVVTACTADDHDEPVDCTKPTGSDEFVVGLQKTGASGRIDFKLMSVDPAPPARYDNTWVVQITTLDAGIVGAPIDGATLSANPFMPLAKHQHGAPFPVRIAPEGHPGHYTLSQISLSMPGVWETTIRATSGDVTDTAVYRFCIN